MKENTNKDCQKHKKLTNKNMPWKVKVRKNCKICGEKLTGRFRTFCSTKCRNKCYNSKPENKKRNYEWQKNKRDKEASTPDNRKVKCLICGKWYVQVGSHIVQTHGFKTCREYREEMNLEVKRGIVPKWYRKLKGDTAIANKTFKNLIAGQKFWFKPGDKRAGNYERSPITMQRLTELGKSQLNRKRNKSPKKWSRKGKCPSCNRGTGSNHKNDCKFDYN
jgi:hypothetical protein